MFGKKKYRKDLPAIDITKKEVEGLPVQCYEADLGFHFQISENEELPFQ